MLKLNRLKAEREKIADSEYAVSGFIPYKTHWNDNTIVTKDNELIQVVRLSGYSFETADDEDLDIRKDIRNMLYKGMSAGEIGLYFHVIRRKQSAYPEDYSSADMPDGFALYLDRKWFDKHRNKETFVNELYVTIVRKSGAQGAIAGVEGLIKKLIRGADKKAWEESMREAYEELEEATVGL